MCWYSNEFNLLTALEDIPIKKVVYASTPVEKPYLSIYRSFVYPKGKKVQTRIDTIYPKRIDAKWSKKYAVEGGAFHSYIPECRIIQDVPNPIILILAPKIEVELDWFPIDEIQVIEGVVPKGAKYAINELGECVSTELILY